MRRLDPAIDYANFLSGKGSGSGWDDGEALVASGRLAGISHPVVIDCGANQGKWTTDVRRLLGSDRGTWLLVEPFDEYVGTLRGLPNVDVIPAAAGEVSESRSLHTAAVGSGWMTLHERHDSFSSDTSFGEQQVEVVRLDDELESRAIDHVDYLKIDVEGHELWVLKGLGRYLAERRVRALTFEFGSANVNSRTFFRDFWDLLVPLGYSISRIAPGGRAVPVSAYYETLEYFRGATNYLATLE